jgi:hypothetical protein
MTIIDTLQDALGSLDVVVAHRLSDEHLEPYVIDLMEVSSQIEAVLKQLGGRRRQRIPEGMVILHRDGNPRNNDISNLHLVNMQRNVTRATEEGKQ